MRPRWFAPFLMLGLGAPACLVERAASPQPVPLRDPLACITYEDCPNVLVCRKRRCVNICTCDVDADCPGAQVCDDCFCLPPFFLQDMSSPDASPRDMSPQDMSSDAAVDMSTPDADMAASDASEDAMDFSGEDVTMDASLEPDDEDGT